MRRSRGRSRSGPARHHFRCGRLGAGSEARPRQAGLLDRPGNESRQFFERRDPVRASPRGAFYQPKPNLIVQRTTTHPGDFPRKLAETLQAGAGLVFEDCHRRLGFGDFVHARFERVRNSAWSSFARFGGYSSLSYPVAFCGSACGCLRSKRARSSLTSFPGVLSDQTSSRRKLTIGRKVLA